jgi:hypothetical protein
MQRRRDFRIASPELFSKLQSEARFSKPELKLVNNSAPRAKCDVKEIFSLQGPVYKRTRPAKKNAPAGYELGFRI